MVQRYDDVGYGVFDMEEDAAGNYVKYEDYVALEQQLKTLAHSVLDAPCDVVTEELAKEVLEK